MKKTMMVGLLLAALATGVLSAGPHLPRRRVEADPNKEYRLQEDCGPWMIMVTTFNPRVTGAADKQRAMKDTYEIAKQLALEVRRTFNIPAYIYPMRSDFGKDLPTLRRGRPRKTSYRLDPSQLGDGLAVADVNEHQLADLMQRDEDYVAPVKTHVREFDQVAVLAGDYATIDQAHRVLDKIKHWNPHTIQEVVRGMPGGQVLLPRDAPGPLWQAFVTPNPYLPSEFLQAQEPADRLVLQMNRGRHNLYDCPGKYSVQVATFAGRSKTDYRQHELQQFEKQLETTEPDLLQRAAADAIELTEALRAHHWQAYVFHDRFKSIVSVGSFDRADDPGLKYALQTFAASQGGNPPELRPKRLGRWKFDPQPLPITVPRRPE